jgi:hypothetical protein
MKSQLNNALAFFQVVAIITNLSTFAGAKIQKNRKQEIFIFYFIKNDIPHQQSIPIASECSCRAMND